ncbi:hypothetical protein O181_045346 [Austropuccinia psidii MF-1]|uniref:Expansin-like EG45 domain-containing protein n=1 Tax=Austropuccinia psidii MF-1 TaxID=1389203 RepID=A0A9Q3HHP4_9BASI|nr:hypothetical protein [Austropuccinia psidii MF-1]
MICALDSPVFVLPYVLLVFSACHGSAFIERNRVSSATFIKRELFDTKNSKSSTLVPRDAEKPSGAEVPTPIPGSKKCGQKRGTGTSARGKSGETNTFHIPNSQANNNSRKYTGKGTNWGASWQGGNCAFTQWPQPKGFGAVAMASNLWDSSGMCGACLKITGTGANATGIVMDQCPSCSKDSLDLDTDIWKTLSGGKPPGIIDISCKTVLSVTGIETTLLIEHTQLNRQTVDCFSFPYTKVQTSDTKGLGDTADLRVTCSNGKVIETPAVNIATSNKITPATGNC